MKKAKNLGGWAPNGLIRHTPTVWLSVAVLALLLAACQSAWSFSIAKPGGDTLEVNRQVVEELEAFLVKIDGEQRLPLERLLAESGHLLVDQLAVIDSTQSRQVFDWKNIAEQAWLGMDGQVVILEQRLAPQTLEIKAPAELAMVQASITDLAPTAAAALGLSKPEQATGRPLVDVEAKNVLLLFLDGYGYLRHQAASADGLAPYLSSLEAPRVGLTIYPPTTVTASAALLSGAPPAVNGVVARGMGRKTEVETLFDVAAAAGLSVRAVEGDALAFQLRNAEFELSGDRNGNGRTDDEVLANALAVLAEGMPDLFFVHFHGIDDAGHTYGPGSPQEQSVVKEVDDAVRQLVEALPEDTLVIIFADHGMHRVNDQANQAGNHANLIPEDMLIPIFIYLK
jgi:hypothetical protein